MAPPRLKLRTSNCSLLIYPQKIETLSRRRWLTYSGRFTHLSNRPSAAGRAGTGNVRGQRSMFYHCATQPTTSSGRRFNMSQLTVQNGAKLPKAREELSLSLSHATNQLRDGSGGGGTARPKCLLAHNFLILDLTTKGYRH